MSWLIQFSLFICLCLFMGKTASADTLSIRSEENTAITDQVIHDYLIRHPEVLIEMTSILQRYDQAMKTKSVIATKKDVLFAAKGDPVVGNPNGDVTLVVFFDNQCAYCKVLAGSLEKILATDKGVRIIYKEFPVLGLSSVKSTKAALAAIKSGKYEAFHNALMADKTPENNFTIEHVFDLARKVGIDPQIIKDNMESKEVASKIEQTMELAKSLELKGVPDVIIGDELLNGGGLVPYEHIVAMIDKERRRK